MPESEVSLMALNVRERAFVHEYIINGGNAYRAALKAGYAKNTAKHAYQWLVETQRNQTRKLPYKAELAAAISAELEKIESAKIADETEILQYLTAVMRKESVAEVVVVEGTGDGCSEARILKKGPDEREATKAAELLGKVRGLFRERVDLDVSPVVLAGYDEVPD